MTAIKIVDTVMIIVIMTVIVIIMILIPLDPLLSLSHRLINNNKVPYGKDNDNRIHISNNSTIITMVTIRMIISKVQNNNDGHGKTEDIMIIIMKHQPYKQD